MHLISRRALSGLIQKYERRNKKAKLRMHRLQKINIDDSEPVLDGALGGCDELFNRFI